MNNRISEAGLDVIRNHVKNLILETDLKPIWYPRDIYMMCHAVTLAIMGGADLYFEFTEYKDFIETLPGWVTIS